MHGANRLASNSLLEVLVFTRRVIEHSRGRGQPEAELPPCERRRLAEIRPHKVVSLPGKPELQELLWRLAGIERSGPGLQQAAEQLNAWLGQLSESRPGDRTEYEMENLLLTGRLVVEAALYRGESRGSHYRTDFPAPDERWRRHIIINTA